MTSAVPRDLRPLRPRPLWATPRFLLGVALVVASVAAVAGLLAAADRTSQVYAARHALAAGDPVSAGDLVAVRVRLGPAGRGYLAAAPEPGTVVTRTVEKGELVPLGALGAAAAQTETSVMVAVEGELPASVVAGRAVDVWSVSPPTPGGASAPHEPPAVLVPGGTVVRVVADSGLGAAGTAAVEVRLPRDRTAALLQAIADGDAITVLPAGR